ncbi:3-carboxyethylcatechol 2,3-dioxygenase [Thauera sp. UPWRP]|nr:3-carboxyethylcatechol 2,3-dioxygenase [Thauera sp.]TMW70780.1 3-carboxyethylcatechol 2,3-dioxygenase [Thauera sp. UPWRP]
MQALLQCLSHTPLKGYYDPEAAVVQEVAGMVATLRAEVEAFDPEVIYLFWPDHLNGFFLDTMPQFCLGISAESVGDYQTTAGPLNVPRELAEACARAVVDAEIDLGFSYRMQVDHGCAQPLEELTGALARYPVVPIFINSVAPPVVKMRRARLLGEAVGRFARAQGQRALFIGSGGLSHNPPVPQMATASDPAVIERLINNRNPSKEARDARQARTIAAAEAFTAGTSTLHPLNAEWDRRIMAQLAARDWPVIDAYRNEDVTADAGGSAHEVKTWVAAVAAMDAACGGAWQAEARYYREIPEWIAGFGALTGRSD